MKTELIKIKSLIFRNMKMYFADKTIFFVSLMSPLILLLLFVLFLRRVYVDSFMSSLPEGFIFSVANIPDAFVAGWLVSALLSISCITVSIGACIIMVQDKLTGAINDIKASPVKSESIMLSYFAATFFSAIMIIFVVLALGLIYIAVSGWYLSALEVVKIVLNSVMLTLLGSLVAVIISSFVKSEGGITAVSALCASIYGFISGAYMPLSQFGAVFSNIFGFNPGLYGSILFKNLFTNGVLDKMSAELPIQAVESVKDSFDINFYFFGGSVPTWTMWLVLCISIAVFSGIVLLVANRHKLKKADRTTHQ